MPLRKHLARGEYVLPRKVDVTPAKGAAALTLPGTSCPFSVPRKARGRSRDSAYQLRPFPDFGPPPANNVERWRVTMKGSFSWQGPGAGLSRLEIRDGQKGNGKRKRKTPPVPQRSRDKPAPFRVVTRFGSGLGVTLTGPTA